MDKSLFTLFFVFPPNNPSFFIKERKKERKEPAGPELQKSPETGDFGAYSVKRLTRFRFKRRKECLTTSDPLAGENVQLRYDFEQILIFQILGSGQEFWEGHL